jgi:RimJ/RimL family protein N-acetyltransferase
MELRGDRLIASTAGRDDAAALLPAFNGDERFIELSGGPPMTLAAAEADIDQALSQPGGAVWRFNASETGQLVGIAITALVPPPNNAWIAFFMIMRPFQRQGYGSEAAVLLERHFFEDRGVARIGLPVHAHNDGALAFWEARGYTRGLLRHDLFASEIWTLRLDRDRWHERA